MTVPGTAALPDRARVVVIGGGIIGTSVAYHLAHAGVGDVVLLERDRLTSGTTWHAAGLMATFGSTSQTSTELRMYTRDLYARLEAETGLATGLKQCGLIELAIEPGRLEEYRRVAAFNRLCGVEVHEISPREVAGLFPLARVDDVLAGFYIPADGRVNPVDVTMSLARGARMQGARIIEGVPVTGFMRSGGAVAGVRTPRGDIEAEYVVNCAGMWARELGELAGVTIPLQSAEHYYLLTEPIEEVDGDWPVLEDPASYGYYREEGGGLMLGLFEPVCAPWQVIGSPGGLFVWRNLPRLGPDGSVSGAHHLPGPGGGGDRDQEAVLRAGELHAGPAADRRRGAGAAELLRGRRAELDRDPDRRGNRPGDRALDRRGPARRRRDGHEHRPAAPLPGQPRVPRDPDRRVAGHGVRDPLPGPADADRARREGVADPPAAGGAAGVLQGRQRLGGRRLVRPGGRRARGRRAGGRPCPGAGRTGSATGRPSITPRAPA